MDIDDPIKGSKDPDGLAGANEAGPDGYFPIGRYQFWHGGVHLRTEKPIVAIRDGVVVAYRIDKQPYSVELDDGKKYEYSTGFVLLRHETATPLGHRIEFWSLSMHLLHWDAYAADPTLETPVYLRVMRPEKVKTDGEGQGLRLHGDVDAASSMGVVPKGGRIVLTGAVAPDGHWAKGSAGVARVRWGTLEGWLKIVNATSVAEPACTRYFSTAEVKVMSADDPAVAAGSIPANSMFEVGTARPTARPWKKHPKGTQVRQVTFGNVRGFALVDKAVAAERRVVAGSDDPEAGGRGVAVHSEPSATSPVTAIIPKGTTLRFKDPTAVRFSASTTYHELHGGGFVPVDKRTLEEDQSIGDPGGHRVVIPPKPLLVSRGDVLGWAGVAARESAAGSPLIGKDNLIHFEVFADSDKLLANPKNEHWFGDAYRLPVGMTLKRSEPLPAAQNPKIAVDLPANARLRISQRFHGSNHIKGFRHEVIGWRRKTELGHHREPGYSLYRALDPFVVTAPPTCWCDEPKLGKVTLGAQQGDYLFKRSRHDVPETFKNVRHERPGPKGPVVTEGWAREHELGDFYPEAHRVGPAAAITLAARPANWTTALDAAAVARIEVPADTWIRRDAEELVSQVFRKLRHGDQEGWVLKERVGPGNAAASTVKLLGDARLLANLPEALDDYGTDPALAELGKGAEATDLGVDASVDEKWVRGVFRDATSTEVRVWVRASEVGPVITDHYVLTAGVNHLLADEPASLRQIEKPETKRLPIAAQARQALEWLGKDKVAKERWDEVEFDGPGQKRGWMRYRWLDDASNEAPDHYVLDADLDHLLPTAPTQVPIGGSPGDTVTVLGGATSAGVEYQQVELRGKKGWWPKDELGTDRGATRELTAPLPHVLKNAPKDPPERVKVTAHADDVVLCVWRDPQNPGWTPLRTDGAYAEVMVIVTLEAERYHGYMPDGDLRGKVPSHNAAFQQPFSIKNSRKEVLTYDPDTTYVFDADAGQVPAERGEVKDLFEFKRSPTPYLRRDKAGHLWTDVEGHGWVNLHLDTVSRKFEEPRLHGASAYDWGATWRKYHEDASKKAGQEFFSDDGLCDVPDLIDLIEKDRQGKPRKDGAIDHEVTVAEMRQALADPDVRAQLRSAACEHPSEWDAGGNGKWERLKKEPWLMPGGLFKSHMEMIEKQQFWADVFPKASPASKVWHFHPLGFIKQLRSMHGVTVDQLLRILPVAKRPNIEKLIAFLNEAMERYEIDTPLRQAHFLSQVGHESAGMRATVEDASGEAYEWRLDLHNVRPGDGKRFKGRGIMQLTGRLNYSLYSAYIGKDLTVDPRPLEEPRLACDSAGWFWRRGKEKDLNDVAIADTEAVVFELGALINGRPRRGEEPNGHKQRLEYFRNAMRVLT